MSTGIQWTDETWNPLRARHRETGAEGWACVRVSPGCVNCYAATLNVSKRWDRGTGEDYTVPGLVRVETYLDERTLTQPLRWSKPRRVFVCSMTDLFGEWLSFAQIDDVFAVMAQSPRHTFQVLTKRPEIMREYILGCGFDPLPNVWLGVSAEDQERADERIPLLLDTPAAVRFVSYEPALGPIEFSDVSRRADAVAQLGRPALSGIDWVIVGGESGPHARPFDVGWARSVVEQCRAAGVAAFVKQLGSNVECIDVIDAADHFRGPVRLSQGSRPSFARVHLKHNHGGNPDEWPEDLRVREFPLEAVR